MRCTDLTWGFQHSGLSREHTPDVETCYEAPYRKSITAVRWFSVIREFGRQKSWHIHNPQSLHMTITPRYASTR